MVVSPFGMYIYDEDPDPPEQFRECQFQVYPMLRYSADSHQEKVLNPMTRPEEFKLMTRDAYDEQLSFLAEATRKEKMMNETLYKESIGGEVTIGSTMQLRHVKSGKFVMAYDVVTAKDETNNMLVELTDKPSEKCWFQLTTEIKSRPEGSFVRNHDMVHFLNQYSRQFLHASDKISGQVRPDSDVFEVNASDHPTSWKLSLVHHIPMLDQHPDSVKLGALSYFWDDASAYS